MRKDKKHIFSGIESRLLILLIICILLTSGVFIGAMVYQNRLLSKMSADTSQQQMDAISEFGEDMIERMVTQEMDRTTELEAMVTNEKFEDLKNRVTLLGNYAASLFEDPENLPQAEWSFPDASMNGEIRAVMMLPDELDASDPAVAERLGQLANMSGMMIDLIDTFKAENAYVALPEGIHLTASRNAGGWVQEDGTLQSFDPRKRYWFKEAVEAGRLIFTDVGDDKETGRLCIVCAMPVYGPDGELAAVAGSDYFLTEIQEAVESVAREDEFHFIVNQKGHVIFSPREEGELRPTGDTHAGEEQAEGTPPPVDLRESENADLAAFITDAMQGNGKTRTVSLEDGLYYMAGAPISSLGWTEITVFSQEKANETMQAMLNKYSEIQKDAVTSYRAEKGHSRLLMSLVLTVLMMLMIALVMIQGRKIVRPLKMITEQILDIKENGRGFEMKDAYRTGDEIEVLAESFEDLSDKTAEYVEQVKTVSAEKERISTELNMATRIQEAMLPSVFPPFPDCPAVDIYASMDPAKEVGGDFYDFFFIDQDHLAMVIADVSGKGVPAALFMMISRTIIKNCAMLGRSVSQILEESNRALCSENRMEMFVTVWLGVLDINTGWVVMANAGHENPVIYRSNEGTWEFLKEKHGLLLGGIDNIRYRENEIRLDPGDKVLIYTDGVPEARNAEGEFFGTGRMLETLGQASSGSAREVVGTIRESVRTFAENAEQFDDITLLCVEYKGQ